jgi:hypothetical protein
VAALDRHAEAAHALGRRVQVVERERGLHGRGRQHAAVAGLPHQHELLAMQFPQPRGGPEDPPPRPVAPPPPGPLPPRQTTRLGIGPPPPEVIHRPGSAATTAAEGQTAPSAPAPRRQLRDK